MANSNTINFNDVLVTGTLTMNSQTVTTSTPILSLSQTWNSGGVTFTGILSNITNTASAAASLLIDLQVGGTSQFKVTRAGVMTITGALTATQFSAATGTITASAPAYTGTQTWNSAGVTFTGILLNITDTASAAASLLIDLQVGGNTAFNVNKSGLTTITLNALGVITSTGLSVTNTTAAAAGVQQYSPAIVWHGNGWKTNATAASQAVDYRVYILPIQSTVSPVATWNLESSINGSAFTTLVTVASTTGNLTTIGLITAGASGFTSSGPATFNSGANNTVINSAGIITKAAGSYSFLSSTIISAPANSQLLLTNQAANDFALLQFGGTTSSFPALKRSGTVLQHRLADDSGFAAVTASAYNVGATAGASGGPFTAITSITVVNGIVTAITGT